MRLFSILVLVVMTTPVHAGEVAGRSGVAGQQIFSPVIRPTRIQSHCGPPNCCLNAACEARYHSQWHPDLGRCGACAVR